ncbi:uncharacterized protein Tco025E_05385 [Trypanosoma conorhini]|uniref:Uncharacterized protein n=1 Tax=Trypanosoma conorhini TaxID=83891 RepID=A0A3R7P1U8_9TRYP|nr:uncharacterized protein Tco025E_05385 [Trypanosoma conorhini]RNF15816.1 hypothetical protein Tco025E_05385 [Trypanosoma conorhini]
MCNSPLLVDQHACPSFFTPRQHRSAESRADTLRGLPLSLRDVAPGSAFPPGDATGPFAPSPAPLSARRQGRSNREVYEAMLRRDAMAAERKEEARRTALQRELSRCRPTPRISAMGHNLPRDTDIIERLERVHEEKQRLDECRRQGREREQQQDMAGWFVPNITDMGHCAEGRALQASVEYPQRRHQREQEQARLAEALRRRRLEAEMAEVYGAPKINLRSAELVRRARARSGGGEAFNADAVLERAALARLALWEIHARREAELSPFSPRITAYAAGMRRSGNVVDRLLFSAETQNPRQSGGARRARSEPRLQPQSGGPAFPRGQSTDPRDAAGRRGRHCGPNRTPADSGASSMEERQRQYQLRREEKIRAVFEAERRLHTPNINPISEMLAASLPVSSTERLMAGRRRGDSAIVPAGDGSRLASGRRSFWSDARDGQRHRGASAQDDGPEEYVSPIQSSGWVGRRTPQKRGNAKMYERMRRWKQRRDDKVQEMRHELQEEKARQLMLSACATQKGVKDAPALPETCRGKLFPEGCATPRAPTGETESARTPVVLSLLKQS